MTMRIKEKRFQKKIFQFTLKEEYSLGKRLVDLLIIGRSIQKLTVVINQEFPVY